MSQWKTKRTKPYTEIGIRRLKCARCSNRAEFQWQICADSNFYRPLCVYCDVALNEVVLKWVKHPDRKTLALQYAREKLGRPRHAQRPTRFGPG